MQTIQTGLQAAAALGKDHPLIQTLPSQMFIIVDKQPHKVKREELLNPYVFINGIGRKIPLEDILIHDPEVLKTLFMIAHSWEANRHIQLPLLEKFPSDHKAEGYVPWLIYLKNSVLETYRFPELYPAIDFGKSDALRSSCVIPIGRRRYRINYHGPSRNHSNNEPPSLTFMEVMDPLDHFKVCDLHSYHNNLTTVPVPRPKIQFFGQPNFLQNQVFPHLNGRAASLLFCADTGWGDCGNENVFIALDEDGRPATGWIETSCS